MDDPVSLSVMLAARERRAVRRREFFRNREEGACLLQITVNIPGTAKNSPMIRDIFDASLEAVLGAFPGVALLPYTSRSLVTGPEGWIEITGPALSVKERTGLLEESHGWGRLWDIDVFSAPDRSLSRSGAGLKERTCYICARPAHECARSGTHGENELNEFIKTLYEEHRS